MGLLECALFSLISPNPLQKTYTTIIENAHFILLLPLADTILDF